MKDLWFAEFEKHLAELEEKGFPSSKVYEEAGKRANKTLPNLIADTIDVERMRRKEGRCPRCGKPDSNATACAVGGCPIGADR